VLAIASAIVAVLVAVSTKGAVSSCGLPDDLPFDDIKVAAAEEDAIGDAISKADAMARASLEVPGRKITDGMLARVTIAGRPDLGTPLAWVFTRAEQMPGGFDANGQPMKTTLICGVTIIDAKSGDLIVAADDSVVQ